LFLKSSPTRAKRRRVFIMSLTPSFEFFSLRALHEKLAPKGEEEVAVMFSVPGDCILINSYNREFTSSEEIKKLYSPENLEETLQESLSISQYRSIMSMIEYDIACEKAGKYFVSGEEHQLIKKKE
jgi:hypothetical protein